MRRSPGCISQSSFPPVGSLSPAAAFPPVGPLGFSSPPSSVLCSSSDSLPPIPNGSYPSPPGTSAPLLSLLSAADAVTAYRPGLCSPGFPLRLALWRWQGLPGSWQAPLSTCPALGLRRPSSPGFYSDSVLPSAQRTASAVASTDFGALSHGRHSRPLPPLLASVSLDHGKGAPGWLPTLTGRDSHPLGLFERFPLRLYVIASPFPRLRLAVPAARCPRPTYLLTSQRSGSTEKFRGCRDWKLIGYANLQQNRQNLPSMFRFCN